MGKSKENPRYEVFSFRANDEEAAEIAAAVPKGERASYFLAAVKEKVLRERQRQMDEVVDSFDRRLQA